MKLFTFPLQAKRLISIALTVLIVLSSFSGPHALSTLVDGNDAQRGSLCSAYNLIDGNQTDTDSEITHCSLCLLNNKIDHFLAVPNNIFLASPQLSSDLNATELVQPYRVAYFTFNSQAPPKII